MISFSYCLKALIISINGKTNSADSAFPKSPLNVGAYKITCLPEIFQRLDSLLLIKLIFVA